MIENLIYKRIQEFAIQPISLSEAKDYIEKSTSSKPVLIFWETLDDGRTARKMFWGKYEGGPASETREKEGMIALVSLDNNKEYRTVIWSTIWKLRTWNADRGRYVTYYVKK